MFSVELTIWGLPTTMFAALEPTDGPRLNAEVDLEWDGEDREPWEVRIAQLVFSDAEGNRWMRDDRGLVMLASASGSYSHDQNTG